MIYGSTVIQSKFKNKWEGTDMRNGLGYADIEMCNTIEWVQDTGIEI